MADIKGLSFFIPMEKMPTKTSQQKGIAVRNGRPFVYTKPEVKEQEDILISKLMHFRPEKPFDGPVVAALAFAFDQKKHNPKEPYNKKPDCDNLAKQILDCMTRAAFWKDDSQVCRLEITKVYSSPQGLQIWIEPWNSFYGISEQIH